MTAWWIEELLSSVESASMSLAGQRLMRLDRGMNDVASSLITTFGYIWARLVGRLGGLSDEEYFWEPVSGCWSLRQDNEGRWRLGGGGCGGPAPDPAPVTTIAWRLGHLGGMAVGGFADRRFGEGKLRTEETGYPATAAGVPGFLDEHYQAWRTVAAARA